MSSRLVEIEQATVTFEAAVGPVTQPINLDSGDDFWPWSKVNGVQLTTANVDDAVRPFYYQGEIAVESTNRFK